MKDYLRNIQAQLVSGDSPFTLKKANKVTTIIPRSFLKVGALIAFRYLGREYTAYIIETKRASTGLYFSSKNNLLVTCLITDLTQVSTQITLSTIYKRRKRSKYEVITKRSYQLEDKVPEFALITKPNQQTGFALYGKENFRTFKVKNIRDLFNLKLKFNKEDEDKDDNERWMNRI